MMARHFGLRHRERRQLIRARNRLPWLIMMFGAGVILGLLVVEGWL